MDPRLREIAVGDPFQLNTNFAADYSRTHTPIVGKRLAFIEGQLECDGHDQWLRLTVDRDTLTAVELVAPLRSELDNAHYLCGSHCNLRGWALKSPNPTDWSDVCSTGEDFRTIWLALLIRENMPARNLHEVALAIETLGCVADGPPARDDRIWTFYCQTNVGDPIELRFEVADDRPLNPTDAIPLPGPGHSQIIPPEVFANLIEQRTSWIGAVPYGYNRENWECALRDLRQGIFYIEDLLRFIPDGESHVPREAFWGDQGLEDRRDLPDRFERVALESLLAEKRELLAEIEREPVPDGQRPRSNEMKRPKLTDEDKAALELLQKDHDEQMARYAREGPPKPMPPGGTFEKKWQEPFLAGAFPDDEDDDAEIGPDAIVRYFRIDGRLTRHINQPGAMLRVEAADLATGDLRAEPSFVQRIFSLGKGEGVVEIDKATFERELAALRGRPAR